MTHTAVAAAAAVVVRKTPELDAGIADSIAEFVIAPAVAHCSRRN